jgi:hypothetical protein
MVGVIDGVIVGVMVGVGVGVFDAQLSHPKG